jgi:hypothetical protein
MYVQMPRIPSPALRFLKWVPRGDNKLDQGKKKSVVIPTGYALLSRIGFYWLTNKRK